MISPSSPLWVCLEKMKMDANVGITEKEGVRAAAVCQEPAPLLLGGPEETGDQLGPGRPAASERTVHRVLGPGSMGTTSRDLPPQPGLGARGRTQTGCWRRLLGSETGRAGSAPPPPPALSQDLGLGGGKLGLVFSRQNRKWYSFRRHLQEHCYLTLT